MPSTAKKRKPKPRKTPPIKTRDDDAFGKGEAPDTRPRIAPAPVTNQPDQFSPAVCRRLRHLSSLHAEYKANKATQIDARDGAAAEIALLGPSEKAKRAQWDAAYGHAAQEIDRLNKSINWAKSETFKTIADADKPELFDIEDKPLPPPSLFEIKPKRDAATVGGENQEGENEGKDAE